jgi:hypothetical protein
MIRLLIALAFFLLETPAWAQVGGGSFNPSGGTLSPDQHNLAITTATGLTPPVGATIAWVQARTASVSYTLDGTTTPTSSVGNTLAAGGQLVLYGASAIKNFSAISATGTLDVNYGH